MRRKRDGGSPRSCNWRMPRPHEGLFYCLEFPRARGPTDGRRTKDMSNEMNGAEMVVQALKDQGVDTIFGYPGGAVLPIYDALFNQNAIRHILVRQEGGAVHAAEGYARSTG